MPRSASRIVAGVFLCVLVGVGTAVSAYGQDEGVGAFSRLGFDAKGMAMGNALVAASSADVSPYYNPALLPSVSGQRVSGSAALMAYDRQLQSLGFTAPLGPTAGIGVGLLHAGVTDIDGRNADGVHTETLSTDEFAVSLAFGNRFAERLSVGVRLTLYQSDVLPESQPVRGFGVDLGVTYRVTPRVKVGGAVTDLLAKYEWDTGAVQGQSRTDQFPVRVLLGGSYELEAPQVRIVGELESRYVRRDREVVDRVVPTTGGPRRETRMEEHVIHGMQGRVGAEYRPIDILHVRMGLDRIGAQGSSGLRPSAGFGLRHQVGELDLRLSYAAMLEPHVRTMMNVGTLEVFL